MVYLETCFIIDEQGCVETYIFRWALTDQEIDTGLDVTYVAILKIRAMRNNFSNCFVN